LIASRVAQQEAGKKKYLERNNVAILSLKNRELFATRRLMRDYREIVRNPLPTVSARPLEGNLFEWHANIKCTLEGTEYNGLVFHLKIEFNEFYPVKPPKVTMCHLLSHHHVFSSSGFICLDMLETHMTGDMTTGVGWSSGYTLQSILIQLQSFLTDKGELSLESFQIQKTRCAAQSYTCASCGHCAATGAYYPPLMGDTNDANHDKDQTLTNRGKKKRNMALIKARNHDALNRDWFPSPEMNHMYLKIFSYVDVKTLNGSVWNSCSSFKELLEKNEKYQIRSKVMCYHTKMTFEEVALGFGVNVTYNGKVPQYVSTKLDLISYFAVFKEGIDVSMWKEQFKFWMPVYINKRHGQAMLDNPKFFAASVERIYNRNFTPKLGLDLLTKLMNSMIVTVMQGVVHASLRAIDGYIAFHRLLIALLIKYPTLQQVVDDKIEEFLTNPQTRRKSGTPSLGDFLPYLTVSSKYSWPQLAIPVLQEVLCRNVLWVVKEDSKLNKVTSQKIFAGREQIERHKSFFKHSAVSLRLIMFHVQFLKHFSPRKNQTLAELAEKYDSYFGYATEEMKNMFQERLFIIQKVDNFTDFFKHCCVHVKNNNAIDEILTDAWLSSKQYGYHQ